MHRRGASPHTRAVHRGVASIFSTDLEGTAHLAVDATVALSDLVEAMHGSIVQLPWTRMQPGQPRTRGLTGFIYRNIRSVSRWVGSGLDLAIRGLRPLLDRVAKEDGGPARDALVAALNGVLGDHLAATGNPLATTMAFRRNGRNLARASGPRCVLMIHGLCLNDAQWLRRGHDHGVALARDLRCSVAYLRYNSGQHVSINGRELADRLERWIDAATTPVEDLAIVGYSLGGLVARSAVHYGRAAGHRWPSLLRDLVSIGTPHQGAPLERGGNWIDMALGMTRYSAPLAALGRARSAGITDLRHGSLLDDDWQHSDRFDGAAVPRRVPLPRGVRCTALAGSTGKRPHDLSDRLLGDGLLPVASALGQSDDPKRRLYFAASRQWVGYGINHLDLLSSAEVYAELKRTLERVPKRGMRGV